MPVTIRPKPGSQPGAFSCLPMSPWSIADELNAVYSGLQPDASAVWLAMRWHGRQVSNPLAKVLETPLLPQLARRIGSSPWYRPRQRPLNRRRRSLARSRGLERRVGIEPTSPAWKAGALARARTPHGCASGPYRADPSGFSDRRFHLVSFAGDLVAGARFERAAFWL